MRATLKKIQAHIDTIDPELEFVKGEGYFYFSFKDWKNATKDEPDSLMIYAMNHMTLEEWKVLLADHISEWAESN